ncbi:metal-sensitive transcriptional regulator [Cetobacterium ceti]
MEKKIECYHNECCHMSEDCSGGNCPSAAQKKKLNSRMNRIEGQIRGIKKMIEEDVYCDEILNQLSSVKAALNGVGKQILEAHMKKCVVREIKNGNEEKVIEELLYTLGKMMK